MDGMVIIGHRSSRIIRNPRGDVGGVGEGTTVLSTCVSTERPTILTGQVGCDFVSSVTFLCVCVYDLLSLQRGPPYLLDRSIHHSFYKGK